MVFECERRRREENFEFLDSLKCYFTYFRTRFEEKLQPQKAFLSRLMFSNVLDRKNIYVKHCIVHANTTAKKHVFVEVGHECCFERKFKFKCALKQP